VLNSNTRVEFVVERMLLVTLIIVTSVLVAADWLFTTVMLSAYSANSEKCGCTRQLRPRSAVRCEEYAGLVGGLRCAAGYPRG